MRSSTRKPRQGLAMALAALAVTGACVVGGPPEYDKPIPQAEVIMEDDPRWDCRTMGNRICGAGSGHPAGQY